MIRVAGALQQPNVPLRSQDDQEFAEDVIRLIQYFKATSSPVSGGLRSALSFWLEITKALIPDAGASNIRKAQLWRPLKSLGRGDMKESTNMSQFGVLLERYASVLVHGGSDDELDLIRHDFVEVGSLENAMDSCVDQPIEPSETLDRLLETIKTASMSRYKSYRLVTWATFSAAMLAALAVFAWTGLRDDSALGQGRFLFSMLGWCVSVGAICLHTKVLLERRLCPYSMAEAHTLSRVAGAVLALATLMLGWGMASKDLSAWSLIIGLLFYLIMASGTISADLMVNMGEARIGELSGSNS